MRTAAVLSFAVLSALAFAAPVHASHPADKSSKDGRPAQDAPRRALDESPAQRPDENTAAPPEPIELSAQAELGSADLAELSPARAQASAAATTPAATAADRPADVPQKRARRVYGARAAMRPMLQAALAEFALKRPEAVDGDQALPEARAAESLAARILHGPRPGVEEQERAHAPAAPPSPELIAAAKKALKIQAAASAIELAGGLAIGSFAVVADSIHLGVDLGLTAAPLISLWLAKSMGDRIKGFNSAKTEAVIALAGMSAIALTAFEAVHHLFVPVAVPGLWAVALASAGLVSNFVCMRILRPFQDNSLGVKAAFRNFVVDTAGSVVIIAASALMMWSGRLWLDPLSNFLVIGIALFFNRDLIGESWRTLFGRR